MDLDSDFMFTIIKTKPIPGSPQENHLVINLPQSWVLKFIARSLLLGLLFITFPWIGSIIPISTSFVDDHVETTDTIFPMLFQDLKNEGLFKSRNDRALFIDNWEFNGNIFIDNWVDSVSEFDVERQTSFPDNCFNLVFTSGFVRVSEFVDRTLKKNGILVVKLNDEIAKSFGKHENYKIVYVRRFAATTTFVAMRKVASSSTKKRSLLAFEYEKRAALDGLEDPLLEPPIGSITKHSKYLNKSKFFPDLLDDSLDEYPRRLFIDVGAASTSVQRNGASIEWFKKNYPTRSLVFEMYKIEMVSEESLNAQLGVSDWLMKNVREEEYLVMKADTEAVEELMSSKAIILVDELFLECKHQWQKKYKSKRAYWECLALYGKLSDQGIAVHQWWD